MQYYRWSDHRPVIVEFSFDRSTLPIDFDESTALLMGYVKTAGLLPSLVSSSDKPLTPTPMDELDVLRDSVLRCPKLQSGESGSPDVMPRFNGLSQAACHELIYDFDPDAPPEDLVRSDLDDSAVYNRVTVSLKTYLTLKDCRRNHAHPPKIKIFVEDSKMLHCALIGTGAELCLIDYHFLRKSCINFSKIFVKIMDARVLLGDNVTEMTIRGYANISVSFINSDGVRVSSQQQFFAITGLLDCVIIGDAFFTDHKSEGANIDQQARVFQLGENIMPYVAGQVHLPLRMPFTATVKAMAKVCVTLKFPEGVTSFNNTYKIRVFSARIIPRDNNIRKADCGVRW